MNAVLSAHVVVDDSVWSDGTAPEVLDRLGECLTGTSTWSTRRSSSNGNANTCGRW